ncbi:MAG TPA: cell division protein FtsL [Actinomycetes bacterium]|nr:cell division protein FtsL [Actinomycetes bacterium]
MSILTALERSARTGPAARRGPAQDLSRRARVRPLPTPVAHPARAPFVMLVLVILSLGLGLLLLLNTLLAQGSFTLHSLDAKVADLADREQALQQRTAELAAPQRLARSAARIGMVPSANPAFLRAEDGKILGEPMPASGPSPMVGSEPATNAQPPAANQQTNGSGQGSQASGGGDR